MKLLIISSAKFLYVDVLHIAKCLDRRPVHAVSAGDNGLRFAQSFDRIERCKCLRAVPVRRQMKPKHKAGFGIHNQPEVMLDVLDFDHCFVGTPFIGVEIRRRNELDGNVLERWKKGTRIN